jgi:hypothetical protein
MADKSTTKNTAIYTGLGVVFLIAATLNYNALQNFAYTKAEVNYWLSFGVPILVDTFIAVAAYIALINKEAGEPTRLAKSIVLIFTLCSIYLNAMHYAFTVAGMSMAALVPIVVFLSVELSVQQMEIKHRRDETIVTIQKLNDNVQNLQSEIAKIEAATVQKTEEQNAIIQAKNAEIAQQVQILADNIAQIEASKLQLEEVKIALHEAENCTVDWSGKDANLLRLDGMLAAGVNYSQAAKVLEVAPNTVRNWGKSLNGNSLSKGQVKQ